MSSDSKIAFLFPGQGSQRPGMLAHLRATRIGAESLAEAAEVLAQSPLAFDSVEAQRGTRATQLGLLIAGVASARLLAEQNIEADFVAGHSVGAFAAAVHAQALRFDDALRLVELRGRLMAQASPSGYGMAAIAGVPERTLQTWIDAARARGAMLYLANRNAARQFTVSGTESDLETLIAHARTHGASNALRLAVAAPSHSPLMDAVAEQMRIALHDTCVADARVPFATNRRARLETDSAAIGDDLASGVAHPVLWHEIVCALYERGVRTFIEMAPGKVLGNLAKSAFDDVHVFALDSANAREVAAALHRR